MTRGALIFAFNNNSCIFLLHSFFEDFWYLFISMRIKIKNNIFKTKLSISEKERISGMSGKRFTDDYNSMLFLQNKDAHCFWMNDCLINLDIIFIKNNEINKIFHNNK